LDTVDVQATVKRSRDLAEERSDCSSVGSRSDLGGIQHPGRYACV